MSTKDDLKSFLVTNIPSQVSVFTLAAGDVYEGQARRIQTSPYEAWVRYIGHQPITRGTGRLERHTVDIALIAMGYDESNEDALTDLIEDAADELIEAYDENASLFRTNLSSSTVSWTRLVRGAISADVMEKIVLLTLTLDEWVR